MVEATTTDNLLYDLRCRYRGFIHNFMVSDSDNIEHYKEKPNHVPSFYYTMFYNQLTEREQAIFSYRIAEKEIHHIMEDEFINK